MVSLKEYVNIRIKGLKQLFNTKFQAIEKETAEAVRLMEYRLKEMNNFREQIEKQAFEFVKSNEHNLKIGEIERAINELKESKANLEGKASQSAVIYLYIISIIAIVLSAVSIIVGLVK